VSNSGPGLIFRVLAQNPFSIFTNTNRSKNKPKDQSHISAIISNPIEGCGFKTQKWHLHGQ
jgi:hypothetical protein